MYLSKKSVVGFYVYAYIRKSNGTPYYIGKGKKARAWAKHDSVSVPKDLTKIIILEHNLSELGAFAIERRLIRWWGRKDLGTGILWNRTDGGEGSANPSADTRKKMSKPGSLNGMYQKTHSDKVKSDSAQRMSKTNTGKRWYNNGIENLFVPTHPGDGWMCGRINQPPTTAGKKMYNNGLVQIMAHDIPGDGWVLGMIKNTTTLRKSCRGIKHSDQARKNNSDAQKKNAPRYSLSHLVYGDFYGSLRELSERYPDQKLNKVELWRLTVGGYKNGYKGWIVS